MQALSLWPPLETIRRYLLSDAPPYPRGKDGVSTRADHPNENEVVDGEAVHLPLPPPVFDLVSRRQKPDPVLVQRGLRSGLIVGVGWKRIITPLLLNKPLGDGRWQTFLLAPECDWASDWDILLEPDDQVNEPLCGMVQTWNSISIDFHHEYLVFGELNTDRMACIRAAVAEQDLALELLPPPGIPGKVALRNLIGTELSALTGTPLRQGDVREEYRKLYREFAILLQRAHRTQTIATNVLRDLSKLRP